MLLVLIDNFRKPGNKILAALPRVKESNKTEGKKNEDW
jgi:hypothetical protein